MRKFACVILFSGLSHFIWSSPVLGGGSWSTLGSGMNGYVNALAWDGSGNLYAGGDFTTAGGVTANYVAKWNGTSWSALGSGINGTVNSFALDGSGNLYAGGIFTVPDSYIAKWNGSSWSDVGSGMDNNVWSLMWDGSSNLYAGGDFFTAGFVTVNHIANGAQDGFL